VSAPVRPATTVDGQLRVPEDVARVGWWDGSAFAGDPFGHTVLAGHVDSATQGLGFFVRLLALRRGDLVRVSGDGHRAVYRVVSVTAVDKDALAVASGAFDQRGAHRLVLITCTGTFDRARGGYSQNLVVTAEPAGPAR
jgi:LPXTG-site transpeptidase (sortase) family protein